MSKYLYQHTLFGSLKSATAAVRRTYKQRGCEIESFDSEQADMSTFADLPSRCVGAVNLIAHACGDHAGHIFSVPIFLIDR